MTSPSSSPIYERNAFYHPARGLAVHSGAAFRDLLLRFWHFAGAIRKFNQRCHQQDVNSTMSEIDIFSKQTLKPHIIVLFGVMNPFYCMHMRTFR